jgi:hypothetical protein
MNRFTLGFLMVVASVASVMAQTTIYSQNFSTTTLPAGWQNVDNTGVSTTALKWQRKTSFSGFSSTSAGNGFMVFISDAASNDNKPENADLISGPINCATNSFVALQFEQFFYTYFGSNNTNSTATVFVSNDNTNWTPVYTNNLTTSNKDQKVIDISSVAANQATVYLKFNYTGDWDGWWAVDDIKVFQPDVLDVAVDVISNNQFVPIGNQAVTGLIKNNGATAINSVSLTYTDNGGSPVSQNFTGLNIAPFQTYPFTFTQPVSMMVAASHNVAVTAYSPNGGSETNTANNSLTKGITSLSGLPKKNALLEEFTTAPCQYCPRGTTTMNTILDNHGDKVIAVALHAGFGTDAMTIADHSTLANAFTGGAPSGMIDRVLFEGEEEVAVSTNVWESYSVEQAGTVTPVSIIADNTYNSGTRELTVNAAARFYGPVSDNFRINCFIVEDSVTGTGSGYNQVNAYNGTSTSEWYQKGNPIIGFQHRHVARQLLGGAWGSAGVINNPTVTGEAYAKQYTYTLPAGWDETQIKLVVVVQHYANDANDRQILNAMEMHLNDADSTTVTAVIPNTGIAETAPSHVSAISLYPNPATDAVNLTYSLSNAAVVSFEIHNIIGQNVQNIKPSELNQGDYRTTINTSEFRNGVYFVAVKEDGKVINTLKFVINK